MRLLPLAVSIFVLVPAVAWAADPNAGEVVFKKCTPCHAVGEGAEVRLGPPLNGIVGRKSGSYPGYTYSDADKNANLVWDEATLAQYLKNPKALIPGTKMLFAGLPNDRDVADVIAYLKQFGPDGKRAP
jgi:cytochrome c